MGENLIFSCKHDMGNVIIPGVRSSGLRYKMGLSKLILDGEIINI